ncbi:putative diguanylate cyclase YegE [Tepidimonas alkaliphilus]|uniref:Putative diguanylate cyclase YegE n=1 Tax=Tepidimonas alkaliphilus TaxID=2588942 RepID=A0A554W6T2_9BURK|nr:GGDEF domain-containing protein [Tepidimonas alkaliphilus]TSE19272.1 putative diguanylate cyclase YegE [Tepidimonas alkaliphilus]
MMLGPRSLRWRLVAVVLLIHAVMVLALVALLERESRLFAEEQVQRRARTLEVELRAALAAPIVARDYVTLDEITRELVAVAEVVYLRVEDVDGRELAHATRLNPTDAAPATVRHFTVALGDARIQLGLDTARASLAWHEFARVAVIWVTLAATAATLLILSAANRLARRIERLSQAAEAWTRGQWQVQAPARADGDELHRLGRTFNAMAREIAERIQTLERARQETAAALEAVQQERARMVALLEAMGTGVLLVDRADRVVYLNEALRRMWMIDPQAPVIGERASDLLARSGGRLAQPDHFSRLVLHVPGTQEVSDSTELTMSDGRIIVQACRPVRDGDERLLGRLWLYEDVTQERRNAEQLIYLAERDGLTGLYNRRRFEEALERALLDASRRQSRCALMLFDLDEFKHLNDHFGHRAGDALLVRVANELSTVVRRNEVLARLGGR